MQVHERRDEKRRRDPFPARNCRPGTRPGGTPRRDLHSVYFIQPFFNLISISFRCDININIVDCIRRYETVDGQSVVGHVRKGDLPLRRFCYFDLLLIIIIDCWQIWILLALCIISFLPSKLLHKYLESFIRKNCAIPNCRYNAFIEWCAERFRTPRVADRKLVSLLTILIYEIDSFISVLINLIFYY